MTLALTSLYAIAILFAQVGGEEVGEVTSVIRDISVGGSAVTFLYLFLNNRIKTGKDLDLVRADRDLQAVRADAALERERQTLERVIPLLVTAGESNARAVETLKAATDKLSEATGVIKRRLEHDERTGHQ